MVQDVYVCDADALINLHNHFDRKALKILRREMKAGKIKLPGGVVREILRRTDKLKRLVQNHRNVAEIPIRKESNPRLFEALVFLERSYGERIRLGQREYHGFWHSRSGRKSADAQVVALAKVYGWTAVSDDRAVKLVCHLENVPCIGWNEFARQLGLGVLPPLFGRSA